MIIRNNCIAQRLVILITFGGMLINLFMESTLTSSTNSVLRTRGGAVDSFPPAFRRSFADCAVSGRGCHGGVQGARESRCITSAFPSCVQRSDAHTHQREEEMDEGLHAHHGEEEKDGGTSTSKATVSRTSQGHL